jgi:uncharacterized damage-inducible protein DinB
MSEDLRFPVGQFEQFKVAKDLRSQFIQTIAELPAKLRAACEGLSEEQLETPYRPEGWTIKQVIHHVADSHSQSLSRFKLGLTEDCPTIKPYAEDLWAELADSKHAPVDSSMAIIEGTHARWTLLLNSMTDADFGKKLNHPERGEYDLDYFLSLYDWHSRHHTAHITELRTRNHW